MTVAKTCIICLFRYEIEVPKEGYKKWMEGVLIQDAMPELHEDDRELFISGVCFKCWPSTTEPEHDYS